MLLSASKSKDKKRKRKSKPPQKETMMEQEVLKFFSSCKILLPYVTEVVRAAREPDGNVANPGFLASSFLQVQKEIEQRLMQSVH